MPAPVKLSSIFLILLTIAGLIPAGWTQDAGQAGRTAREVEALNQTLAAPGPRGPEYVSGLLRRRAELFDALIEADPEAAIRLALRPDVSDQLRESGANPVETTGEWTGLIESAVEDDFEHQRSRTHWYLRVDGGPIEIFSAGRGPLRAGDFVRVRGVRSGRRAAIDSITNAAETGPPQATTPAAMQDACTTTGPQKVAVLMLTMPSMPALPASHSAANLQTAFFGGPSAPGATDSLDGFWKEMSYGLASATGQVFGPFALNQDYTCEDYNQITTAGINAADSTVDFSQFTRVAFIFPVSSCPSYSGRSSLGCQGVTSPSKGSLQLSTTWLPAFPNTQSLPVGLYAHEMGHALGLNHSSTDDYGNAALGALNSPGAMVEYGDPFSLMGYPYNGSGKTAGHYPAQHKGLVLNWLTPGRGYQEVTSSGTYTVQPFESQSDPRGLRILRDPVSSTWLWIEYRQPIGAVDSALQSLSGTNVYSGALIHYEDPAVDSLHSYLLDFNPTATPNDFADAALSAGRSWSDPYSLLTLTINPTSGPSNTLSVSVNYDSLCATLQFSSTSFDPAGGVGTIAVTANSSCSWTASTTANWITFNGPVSGQGNGSISFTVASNTGVQQRNAFLAVQRQSTSILQAGSGPTVNGVNPVVGTGASGQFTVQLSHPSGYQSISSVTFRLDGAEYCQVTAYPSGRYLYLWDSVARTSLGPLMLSTPGGTLSNSVCSVSTSGSSINGSGNQLQVTLQMNFFAAFAGGHRVTAWAGTATVSSPTVPVGTWIVPSTQTAAVTIASNTAGAPFQLDGGAVYQAPVTFYWDPGAQHTIAWLSTIPGQTNARYTFQSWSGGGTNPRTITVPSTAVTYTADVAAEFRLTITLAPAAGGAVTVTPASSDGFYASGTNLTLTPSAAAGYAFWYFSGDPLSAGQTLAMTGPKSVTANFYCNYSFNGAPGQSGPGPYSGYLVWTAGSGCGGSLSSNATWLTVGAPINLGASTAVPVAISENTGGGRTATLTFDATSTTYTFPVTQDGAGVARPSLVSFTPGNGSGPSQAFTAQFYDSAGYSYITSVSFQVQAVNGGAQCSGSITFFQGVTRLFLTGDSGSTLGPLILPGIGTLQNSSCTLSAASSAASGSGRLLNITLGLSFTPAFNGPKQIILNAYGAQYSTSAVAGVWTVSASACTYALAATGSPAGQAAGSGSVAVTAPAGCAWTASSNISWLTVTAGASGTGNGSVTYGIEANTGVTARSGTLTIAGQTFTVDQAGAGCTYVFSPPGASYTSTGGGATFTVTAPAGCSWTASSNASWLRLTGTISGSGTGVISYTVDTNSTAKARSGAITAGGSSFNVGQAVAVQSNQKPGVVSLSPFAGSGSQTFTLAFSDANGWDDIAHAYLLINVQTFVSASCYVDYNLGANTLSLMNDAGTVWLGPIAAGSTASLANSQCSVNGTGAARSGSGNDVTMTVPVSFQASYNGGVPEKRVYLMATDSQGASSDWLPFGIWYPTPLAASKITRYRLYFPVTKEHLYTTDLNEYNVLGTRGWNQEGADASVFNGPATVNGVSTVPMWRLYFTQNMTHLWTTDRNEYVTLMTNYPGVFLGEGADQFLMPSQIAGTIPLYRLLFNGGGPPVHHWTTDAYEVSVLTAPAGGWTGEGIPGYLYPPGSPAPASEFDGAVISSGSYESGPVAPGQRVRLVGRGGDADEVRIGGRKAQIVPSDGGGIEVIVPPGIDAGRAEVELVGRGRTESRIEVGIAEAAPALLTRDPYGRGQAVAWGEDGRPNGSANPATTGSILRLQVTGDGGKPLTVTIGGYPAEVTGVTPGTEPGITELSVRIPETVTAGDRVPVRVKAGEFFSQSGVTVAIAAR